MRNLPSQAPTCAKYLPVPLFISGDKKLGKATKELKGWLYQQRKLELYRSKSPKLESIPYESLGDFKVRLKDVLDDRKEAEIDRLQERYGKKEQVLLDRLSRAEARVEKEEADTSDAFLSTGIAVLSALFGRSSSAKVGTAVNRGRRAMKERADVSRAAKRVDEVNDDIEQLTNELENKIDTLMDKFDIDAVEVEEFSIKLRKADIKIDEIAIVWQAD